MTETKPGVLFVCVKNGGKSQMAAGLMQKALADRGKPAAVRISSAGTKAGEKVNALSAEVLQDVGVDITDQKPTQLTEEAMREAGRVIVLGAEAEVPEVEGVTIERWETDEPSQRGIEGRERMELVRDDIRRRVVELTEKLV
ncbi:low molecular weight phosphatase family protein [Nesterenkonia sp. MY13]|uniref:Low molecular weight phosphatase family protein n=1 Tax=Nesterenkonia sedimenti TaxID=1463632 RepID=A0A7X8TKT6_9MICC|nr:low molecular weight phosphatase family protein [Nesterenkonia sedimenti]NLS10626.1 low molecular weight phosphatase family protein [Nesterenkonia sedimenti]